MKKLHRGGSNPDGEPLSAGRVEYLEAARQRVHRRRLRRLPERSRPERGHPPGEDGLLPARLGR